MKSVKKSIHKHKEISSSKNVSFTKKQFMQIGVLVFLLLVMPLSVALVQRAVDFQSSASSKNKLYEGQLIVEFEKSPTKDEIEDFRRALGWEDIEYEIISDDLNLYRLKSRASSRLVSDEYLDEQFGDLKLEISGRESAEDELNYNITLLQTTAQNINSELDITFGAAKKQLDESGILEEVKNISPDYIVTADDFNPPPNDPYWVTLWGLHNPEEQGLHGISMLEAWEIEQGDPNVVIAVLDTGVDYNHPDLEGNIIKGYDFVNNDNDPMDDNHHGTHVAGTIVAKGNNNKGVVGVCPECKVLAIKVLNDQGRGFSSKIIEGVLYAAENQNVKVINLSLTGMSGGAEVFESMVDDIVIAASAGNSGSSEKKYPAAYDGVLSVASTNSFNKRSGFSNYGDWVNIAAPGTSINSTALEKDNFYKHFSGTSMASPHVAGLAGLLYSTDIGENCSADEMRDIILDPNNTEEVNSDLLDARRINAHKALLDLTGGNHCGSTQTETSIEIKVHNDEGDPLSNGVLIESILHLGSDHSAEDVDSHVMRVDNTGYALRTLDPELVSCTNDKLKCTYQFDPYDIPLRYDERPLSFVFVGKAETKSNDTIARNYKEVLVNEEVLYAPYILNSHTNGSTLNSSDVTFFIGDSRDINSNEYEVAGDSEYPVDSINFKITDSSGNTHWSSQLQNLNGDDKQINVSGLPIDGRDLKISITTNFINNSADPKIEEYTIKAAIINTAANLFNPGYINNNHNLPRDGQFPLDLEWENLENASYYYIYLGSDQYNPANMFAKGYVEQNSNDPVQAQIVQQDLKPEFRNIDLSGETILMTLYSYVQGNWVNNTYWIKIAESSSNQSIIKLSATGTTTLPNSFPILRIYVNRLFTGKQAIIAPDQNEYIINLDNELKGSDEVSLVFTNDTSDNNGNYNQDRNISLYELWIDDIQIDINDNSVAKYDRSNREDGQWYDSSESWGNISEGLWDNNGISPYPVNYMWWNGALIVNNGWK